MKKTILAFCVGLAFTGYTQTTLQTSLVACYPLDCDNAVNSATTGAALDAIAFPNVSCASGHTTGSNGYSFNGNTNCYIQLPGSTSPGLRPQAITFSGWFNVSNINNGQYLLWTDNGCSSFFEAYALAVGSGNFQVVKYSSNCSSNTQVFSTAGYSSGTWYHVAFTLDNSNMELFVNGASVASSAVSNAFGYFGSADVYLGGTANSGAGSSFNAPFTGVMDNLRFYDRILSAAEIAYLYSDDPACTSTACPTCTSNPPSGCCLGNYCNASTNALTGDYQISTANNDFYFTDDGSVTDKVNIGYGCSSATIGKLNTFTKSQTNASPTAGVSPYSAAIFGHSAPGTPNVNNAGVMGFGENYGQNVLVYGVWGRAQADGGDGIGVRGNSQWPNSNTNFGGSFYAERARFNIGVDGSALSSSGSMPPLTYQGMGVANIGVYGGCWGPNAVPGPPTIDYAGWFDGDVNIVGNAYCSLTAWTSDKRFKTNIQPIEHVADKISRLSGYTYEFKTEEFAKRNFPKGEQIGFLAQELKEVFPQLVVDDKQGYLAVNYVGFIPVLLQAVKEQQQQINELKALLNTSTGSVSNPNATSIAVTLSDKNTIVLNQNVPNPFAESTVITYNIPTDFGRAQILFSTNDGSVIKVIDIKEKGAGSLSVFANDLTHGMYTYSLVVDGKTIASKKMVKE